MHSVPANDVIGIFVFYYLHVPVVPILSTGEQLIIRRKYPNAPESETELFRMTIIHQDQDQGD